MNELPCDECREAESAYWRLMRVVRKDAITANGRKRRLTVAGAARTNRKRAIKMGVQTEWYSPMQIVELYGENCHLCNEPIDLDAPRQVGKLGWEKSLHIDHVIPLSKGGHDLIENVRPAHGYCNNIKSDTLNYGHKFSGNQERAS
jgi:5-methylcytosine-specific restriction endonuclease McrA